MNGPLDDFMFGKEHDRPPLYAAMEEVLLASKVQWWVRKNARRLLLRSNVTPASHLRHHELFEALVTCAMRGATVERYRRLLRQQIQPH